MEQHPTTWRVGNVKISKIVEMELGGAPSDLILKGLTPAEVQAVSWLQPHFATADGSMNLTIQAFVIESEGKKIIVDTCVGNDKTRDFPPWNDMHGPFLTDLAAAGFSRESIVTVEGVSPSRFAVTVILPAVSVERRATRLMPHSVLR